MSDAKSPSLGGLVDIDKGIVSREIFVNDEIYRQELEQVFARAWLFVGHESQIPRPATTWHPPWAKSRSSSAVTAAAASTCF